MKLAHLLVHYSRVDDETHQSGRNSENTMGSSLTFSKNTSEAMKVHFVKGYTIGKLTFREVSEEAKVGRL